MLSVWTENRKPVHSVFHDASRLTLNVITCAGFGLSYHFRASQNSVKEGHSMSYGDALMSVMDNIVLLVLVPFWMLNLPMIPKALANFKTAICEFKDYMADMVELAKKEAAKNGIVHPNLLNTLVQKSQEMVESKNVGASGLTDGEIYGNLFVFSFAGFETTASTLTYAIYLLAAYPKWQDWLVEEIQSVCGDLNVADPPSYETLFPKLNRCLAAIVCSYPTLNYSKTNKQNQLETLRLFPVVLKIPKNTGDSPQDITVKGRDYTIPADTDLLLNVVSLHRHSEYWGDDAQVWRPDRFIEKSSATSATLENETLRVPTPGSFVPWADGPRNCPGKKFAQVELVAVIAKLLHGHKIEVKRNLGETDEQARERVLSVTQDSEAILILHMRKSESVKLNFVKREI
jgi:cytochrome P450